MLYIGITQPTINWLLIHKETLHAVYHFLSDTNNQESLINADVVEGVIRIRRSTDGNLICIWNIDYLGGTGEETWGFVKCDEPFGVFNEEFDHIKYEIYERCNYVLNQRLQGLILESSLMHRSYGNHTHTCLAGRGSDARQYSICYCENVVNKNSSEQRSVLCIGPSREFDALSQQTEKEGEVLSLLVFNANQLITGVQKKPVLGQTNIGLYNGQKQSDNFGGLSNVTVPMDEQSIDRDTEYNALSWKYEEWIKPGSTLSSIQRQILMSDTILERPLRIIGPAGSGKSLLMQLLVMRRLKAAKHTSNVKIIYIVHNSAMAQMVSDRFQMLGIEQFLETDKIILDIKTLAEYGRDMLGLDRNTVIDIDAHESKMFQLDEIKKALKISLKNHSSELYSSKLLQQIEGDDILYNEFCRLVMAEFSTAIKGHGLIYDKKRYVESERSLSRLHGLLLPLERIVIFEAFEAYHKVVFEEYEVLDSDDIALSLLGRLRTPLWNLKRKETGYDFIFVDETQLFNENERRLFSLLSKNNSTYTPVVLALDEAQEPYSFSSAGFGALGIESIGSASLPSNHRSTEAIVSLAFFVIQKSTDLFGPEFPDFTATCSVMIPNKHPLADFPHIEVCNEDARSFGHFVLKRVRELRRSNIRQIAIVCHSDLYWDTIVEEFQKGDLPVQLLLRRGEPIPPEKPLVILTRPAYVGGQEFDAVLVVGLEQGLVPPRILDNEALAVALEQQVLREVYLTFTRARYRLLVLIQHGSSPSALLQEAKNVGLIQ